MFLRCGSNTIVRTLRSKETAVLKMLIPVDGSESAVRATEELIKTLDWYKERPRRSTRRSPARISGPQYGFGISDEIIEP